jgi:hypothetical protein
MSTSTPLQIVKPPRATNTKGEPPAPDSSVTPNTQKAPSTGSLQLAVQVPAETRRAFKAYAAERDMSMSDLFIRMWDEYRRTHA